MSIDTEKAFDSLNPDFLIKVLEKIGFKTKSVTLIKFFLGNQESCTIDGCSTSKYINLEKGIHQGDPMSVHLFITALEVLFILIKNNSNIKGIKNFDHVFLYTAFADDFTFFLNDINSIKKLMFCSKLFSAISGPKPNNLDVKLLE